ncbi:S41 family peptidase [Tellurirhabdus rosea]|uniref:S41 family peptidase n=1 Tax=Tellurirhabdus rosea TaxID=2674997 RepID=UPI00224D888E|nr:S41 family peptidase [Tellurirhabdus rosea]
MKLLRWLLCLLPFAGMAQTPSNLDFERLDPATRQPAGWSSFGSEGYAVGADSLVRHGGRYSFRIQSIADNKDQAFKACGLTIPARYAGKEIELTGFVKTQDLASGWAGLWMRIDGTNRTLEFDNMESRGIKGTTDWTQYSVKLRLPDDAERITFGGLLSGPGTAWFDDLTVRVSGEELAVARLKKVVTAKAKLDSSFRRGSGIELFQLKPQQIENLAVLGRVWGFLKYHHPAVAEGNYNWDYELFRVMPKVLNARSAADRSAVLSTWIQNLGPLPKGKQTDTTGQKNAFRKPDLRWLNNRTLFTEALSRQLNQVYQNRNRASHYYLAMESNVGNPSFRNEDAYGNMAFSDGGLRMLSLFRYWNIIEYFFPYKHLIQEDWNAVLTEFIPRLADCTDSQQYILTNLQLIARIHDTHANIWGRQPDLERWRGVFLAPVQVRFVENQAVVTGYYHDSAGRASGLRVGDVIRSIDGKPVADWVREKTPYYPASNHPTRLRDMARDLLRGPLDSVSLAGERDGKPFSTRIKRYGRGELALNYNLDSGTYPQDSSYRMLPDSIGFIYPAKYQNKQLPAIKKAFKNAKGIIIDLRCYPSDFMVFTFGSFLHMAPTPFVKFTGGDVSNPGLFTWSKELNVGSRGGEHFPGKVVVLINEATQSQAEYTTMAFRGAPNVTVIGSQTAGADGNVSPFTLPGGLSTMISGIGVYYPDGRETQRIGIVPDLEVRPTIRGIREGRDELLEKAIELIKKSPVAETR